MTVVDASLLIDEAIGLPAGRPWRRWVAAQPRAPGPDCIGVELGRYLRRHLLRGNLDAEGAQRSLSVFRRVGVLVYPTPPLLQDALALRDHLTFDDALYVALARQLREPLATTDARVARAATELGVGAVPTP